MSETKAIIRRAIKSGFDLSAIPNYSPKKFKSDLWDYLVEQKFFVTEDAGFIVVGYDIIEDTAEVSIDGTTMKVKPLAEFGFFEILIHLFKFISISSKNYLSSDNDDDPTEDYSEESSEEIWL